MKGKKLQRNEGQGKGSVHQSFLTLKGLNWINRYTGSLEGEPAVTTGVVEGEPAVTTGVVEREPAVTTGVVEGEPAVTTRVAEGERV